MKTLKACIALIMAAASLTVNAGGPYTGLTTPDDIGVEYVISPCNYMPVTTIEAGRITICFPEYPEAMPCDPMINMEADNGMTGRFSTDMVDFNTVAINIPETIKTPGKYRFIFPNESISIFPSCDEEFSLPAFEIVFKVIGDGSEGIESVSVDAPSNQKAYKLNGQEAEGDLQQLPSGIYIIGGKKVAK